MDFFNPIPSTKPWTILKMQTPKSEYGSTSGTSILTAAVIPIDIPKMMFVGNNEAIIPAGI